MRCRNSAECACLPDERLSTGKFRRNIDNTNDPTAVIIECAEGCEVRRMEIRLVVRSSFLFREKRAFHANAQYAGAVLWAVCAELQFRQLIFIGAVGALKEEFRLGDVCTPVYSLSGSYADAYLMKDSIGESMLFTKVEPDLKYVDKVVGIGRDLSYEIRKASVFCTPSVALEYTHLDEIRAFDTDLIEMETASFYLMADLFELPAVALLVVSDNSASGVALIGRTEEEQAQYERGRCVVLPAMILALAAQ